MIRLAPELIETSYDGKIIKDYYRQTKTREDKNSLEHIWNTIGNICGNQDNGILSRRAVLGLPSPLII